VCLLLRPFQVVVFPEMFLKLFSCVLISLSPSTVFCSSAFFFFNKKKTDINMYIFFDAEYFFIYVFFFFSVPVFDEAGSRCFSG